MSRIVSASIRMVISAIVPMWTLLVTGGRDRHLVERGDGIRDMAEGPGFVPPVNRKRILPAVGTQDEFKIT